MLIIYGSNYGYARRYAEKFAELSGEAGSAYDYREFPRPVKAGEKAIYFAAMYAGGLKGLKKTAKKLVKAGAKMYIVTVGSGTPWKRKRAKTLKKRSPRRCRRTYLQCQRCSVFAAELITVNLNPYINC